MSSKTGHLFPDTIISTSLTGPTSSPFWSSSAWGTAFLVGATCTEEEGLGEKLEKPNDRPSSEGFSSLTVLMVMLVGLVVAADIYGQSGQVCRSCSMAVVDLHAPVVLVCTPGHSAPTTLHAGQVASGSPEPDLVWCSVVPAVW